MIDFWFGIMTAFAAEFVTLLLICIIGGKKK